MKTIFSFPCVEPTPSALNAVARKTITLDYLIANLVNEYLPAAHQKNTNVVNKIGQDILLYADMSKVIGIIDELLSVIVTNSENGNIHISADRFRDSIILEIQERNNYNGYALASRISSIGPEAAVLGGYISMTSPQKKITTVTFSFPYQLQVA